MSSPTLTQVLDQLKLASSNFDTAVQGTTPENAMEGALRIMALLDVVREATAELRSTLVSQLSGRPKPPSAPGPAFRPPTAGSR